MANSVSWNKIFTDNGILTHDFNNSPYYLSALQIKRSCQSFRETSEKEVRILCKQDSRDDRPDIFVEHGLFLLPVKNGHYAIIKGEGYVDIPDILGDATLYRPQLAFSLDTVHTGDSEMQHLDYAYALSIIRTFCEEPSLVLTIRGRKYTPPFNFSVNGQTIEVSSVQTEVDAGYEGERSVVLIEAKNKRVSNEIIRQLYYPLRQWYAVTRKRVRTMFFCYSKEIQEYHLWEFHFEDINDYNSIRLLKSQKFKLVGVS